MKWTIPFLLFSQVGWAGSVGPFFAGTCANDASYGTNAWTTVTNACAEDALVATESGNSQYIKATNLGVNVPNGARIVGIVAEVKKAAITGQFVTDASIRLYVNGVVSGTDHVGGISDWPSGTLTWFTYGSSTDNWGLNLHGSDINNSNFGLAFACQKDAGGVETGQVDAVRFTFYYALPGGLDDTDFF